MTINDLTPDQLEELRVTALFELFAAFDMGDPSYMDIMTADHYVTDSFLWERFDGVAFCNDDFTCTAA